MLKSPNGGLRIGGVNYPSGAQLPEKYRRVLDTSMRPSDPARGMNDSPPNMGRLIVPQTITFSGMSTSLSKAYRYSDEAMRHSIENAHMMLNDPVIAGPLLARQYMVSLLNWSIASEDDKDPQLKDITAELQAIIKRTPRFTEYRRALLEAVWYGRYGCQNAIGFHTDRRGIRRRVVRKWMPLSGDKLVFRYDDGRGEFDPDQVGIRVSPALGGHDAIAGQRQLEATGDGMAYFLEPWERRQLVIHKHMIRDGEYEDPISGGQVHGVGLRHFLYWVWWQKQEALAQVAEIIDRTGMGFTIYYYPSGNNAAREEMAQISREQAHTNTILMPSDPANETRIEQLPPNTAGLQVLHDLIESFFGDMIVRFILGQTLSTKPDATGMNSGVADLQKDTLYNICRYDAVNLEETITNELLLPLRDMNFPKFRNVDFYFRISTKVAAPEQELQALQQLWQMGAQIKIADIFDRLDLSMPDADDKTLFNPAIVSQIDQYEQQKQAQASGQMPPGMPPGMPGAPGQPPGQPPLPGQGPPSMGPPAPQQGPPQAPPEQQPPAAPPQGPPAQEPVEQAAKDADPDAEERKRLFGPILYGKKESYAERVANAIAQTDTNPSAEQRKAGNYRKGRAWLHGLEVVIETPQGIQRRPEWKPLAAHYGYLRRIYDETKQKVTTVGDGNDKDHIDVFVGPHPDSHLVFIIDQLKENGKFDEWKVILGCNDDEEAKKLYLACYPSGWKMGEMTPLTIWDLKELLLTGHRGKQAAKHKYSKVTPQQYARDPSEWIPYVGKNGGRGWQSIKTGKVDYDWSGSTPGPSEQSPAAGQIPAQGGMAAKPAMPALPAIAASAPGDKPVTPAQQPSWQTQPMESQAQAAPPVVSKEQPATPPTPQPTASDKPPEQPPAEPVSPKSPTTEILNRSVPIANTGKTASVDFPDVIHRDLYDLAAAHNARNRTADPKWNKPISDLTNRVAEHFQIDPTTPANNLYLRNQASQVYGDVQNRILQEHVSGQQVSKPKNVSLKQPPAAEQQAPETPAAPSLPPHAQAELEKHYQDAESRGITDEILRLSGLGKGTRETANYVSKSAKTGLYNNYGAALNMTRAVRHKHDQMTPEDHQELQQWSAALPAPKEQAQPAQEPPRQEAPKPEPTVPTEKPAPEPVKAETPPAPPQEKPVAPKPATPKPAAPSPWKKIDGPGGMPVWQHEHTGVKVAGAKSPDAFAAEVEDQRQATPPAEPQSSKPTPEQSHPPTTPKTEMGDAIQPPTESAPAEEKLDPSSKEWHKQAAKQVGLLDSMLKHGSYTSFISREESEGGKMSPKTQNKIDAYREILNENGYDFDEPNFYPNSDTMHLAIVRTDPSVPPVPESTPPQTGVPVMITNKMKDDLLNSGLSRDEISKMTPQQAWDHLNKQPDGTDDQPYDATVVPDSADSTAQTSPDQGQSSPASLPDNWHQKLPPVKPGHVRLYHGGQAPQPGEKRWLTPDPKYAEGYAAKSGDASDVHYVDIPETHPSLVPISDVSGTNMKPSYSSFDADPDIASQLRPVSQHMSTPSTPSQATTTAGQPGSGTQASTGPKVYKPNKAHIAAVEALPEGSMLFGHTKSHLGGAVIWDDGKTAKATSDLLKQHHHQAHLDTLDHLAQHGTTGPSTPPPGPAPGATGTGRTPRSSRPFHASEMPHISTTAAIFGIVPGNINNQHELRNFMLRTARTIGFDPSTVQGDRTDQAVAASKYLNDHKTALDAVTQMAKAYGWGGGSARELAHSARYAGRHLVNEAAKRGWTPDGNTEQERMANAIGFLQQHEASNPSGNNIHAITQILGQMFAMPQKWTPAHIALAVAGFYVGYKLMRHVTSRRRRRYYW